MSIFFFLIRYFLHVHFQWYPKSLLYPPPPLPYPHTPTSWPWHFHLLRYIKFARPLGLSFHWWPTRTSSDTYAARDTSSGGYWLVHIVVPPIGLQIPSAPWVLSLAPPWGHCDPSNSWLWASTSVFARPQHSLTETATSGSFQQNLASVCNGVSV